MELIIKGTSEEIKSVLQTIESSQKHAEKKPFIDSNGLLHGFEFDTSLVG